MSAAIAGIGTWLPEQVRTNDAWPPAFGREARGDRVFNDIPPAADPVAAALVARDLSLEALDPFLGATRRHVADEGASAGAAETEAARAALADAGLLGGDVDVVISSAIVPDRIGPPSASAVAHGIGAKRALAFGMDSACASAVVQIELAHGYLSSGLARCIVLTQSHLLLRAMPMLHPATPGLGDAASALVMTREGRYALRSSFGVTHGEHERAVTWVRSADEADDIPWWKAGGDFRLGSHAPALTKMLMRDTVSYGALTLREAAERAGVDVERIAALASVQPRGFLPGAIAEHLGLPRARAVTTYDDIAHVGACGPVFNLARARERGLLAPGAIVALYGQGAGFTRIAALLEVAR